jgi:hypothetical protein
VRLCASGKRHDLHGFCRRANRRRSNKAKHYREAESCSVGTKHGTFPLCACHGYGEQRSLVDAALFDTGCWKKGPDCCYSVASFYGSAARFVRTGDAVYAVTGPPVYDAKTRHYLQRRAIVSCCDRERTGGHVDETELR